MIKRFISFYKPHIGLFTLDMLCAVLVAACDLFYPVIAKQVGKAVAAGEADCGILVCGTGIGMSIAANKVKGIRAACCSDTFSARFTKMHNNTNVLCFGGRVLGAGLALDIVDAYLDAEFEGGRHEKRVNMMMDIEND